jgi:hypothetical protein
MATFDNELLFNSGPTRFKIGKVVLRHAAQQPPGSMGVRLESQGREARQITQEGTLTGDTPEQLQQLVDAIEAKVDGLAYKLVDDLDRDWNNVAMLSFDTEPYIRIGARWKTEYRVEYLQVLT